MSRQITRVAITHKECPIACLVRIIYKYNSITAKNKSKINFLQILHIYNCMVICMEYDAKLCVVYGHIKFISKLFIAVSQDPVVAFVSDQMA